MRLKQLKGNSYINIEPRDRVLRCPCGEMDIASDF